MSAKNYEELADDPRITAYALGELEGDECAEIEMLAAKDARVRAMIEELRGMGQLLSTELGREEVPGLTDEQRRAVEDRSAASSTPRRRGRLLSIRSTVAVITTVAAVALVSVGVFLRSKPSSEDSGEYLYNLFGGGSTARVSTGQGELLDDLGYSSNDSLAEFEIALASKSSDRPQFLAHSIVESGPNGAARPTLPASRSVASVRERELQRALVGLGYVDELYEARELILKDSESLERYDPTPENEFELARDKQLSTFSIDVDTASYANVRRFLTDGQLPPVDAVRIEELVNYFTYDYAGPRGETPFAVHVEVGGCPWAPRHRLVRIGLKGREIGEEGRKPSNLVFLFDVSGSMNNPDKLPLLKRAMQMLVQELGEQDRVAIVVYAGAAGLVLPSTPATAKWQILEAIERLNAGGSTAGGAGIRLAYDVAARNFIQGGINRVILATDGDFNVGVSDDGSLVRMVEEKRSSGVSLSVLGFGRGNLKDSKMEKLADNGNGSYAYIDTLLEAKKVLVEELGATLETIAKDVKIQVEFNPVQVEAYRLIGYENRMLAARDFNDDTKDAGEIGAGHTVTALYEIVPAGQGIDVPEVDPSRYQTPAQPSDVAFSGELMNLKLRYKQPDGDESTLIEFPVSDEGGSFFEASSDFRFAASVAAFGMLLRDSKYAGAASLEEVEHWATESSGDDSGGYRSQFLLMVRAAAALSGR